MLYAVTANCFEILCLPVCHVCIRFVEMLNVPVAVEINENFVFPMTYQEIRIILLYHFKLKHKSCYHHQLDQHYIHLCVHICHIGPILYSVLQGNRNQYFLEL